MGYDFKRFPKRQSQQSDLFSTGFHFPCQRSNQCYIIIIIIIENRFPEGRFKSSNLAPIITYVVGIVLISLRTLIGAMPLCT